MTSMRQTVKDPTIQLSEECQKIVDNIDIANRARTIIKNFILLTGGKFYMHNVENYLRSKPGFKPLSHEDKRKYRCVANGACTVDDIEYVEALSEAYEHTKAMMGR